ncbi:hypothetical protein PG994_015018 [Apiospora phragmitis]|uniref:Uncharacterized protein n=1 Tax=Apiospora phragmitis TaxID=2905665 RepID=A0ABR1SV88_9PEZI
MRSAIFLGAAALVAASPAPQALDFAAVHNAPAPTGPATNVASQAGVYNAAAASTSATAAVTAVASAPATAAEKRSLDKRTFCWWFWCPVQQNTAQSSSNGGSGYGQNSPQPTNTGYNTVPMSTAMSAPATTATTPVAASSPVPTSTGIVPSTCTPISWTNTFDPCAPQPDGYGPVAKPDTAAGFVADTSLHAIAKSAKDPQGYASTFKDLTAAVNANTYLGFDTLKSYDVASCAAKCDTINLCTSFNIYMERDPAWNGEQCSCPMPNSITNYKCSYWGSGVTPEAATNNGQTRGDGFQVVITGSNGYSKTNTTTPVTPPGCTKPTKCGAGGAVHDHPRTCIGQHFFPGPFDISLCANYAKAQNAKNVASGIWSKWLSFVGYNPSKCNFFNGFMIKENGVAKGTYCKLFAQQYEGSAATYQPGWQGSAHYEVESSWSFCM